MFGQGKNITILLLFLCSLNVLAQETSDHKKNVLFIAVDDLRPELSCYGHTQIVSPHIDQLASGGMLFTNAATQQAVCTPSRISMLLGLRPATTGLFTLDDKMKTGHSHLISIPHALKKAGYSTYSIGKIYHHKDDDPDAWTEGPWRDVGNQYTLNYSGELKPPTEANDVADNAYPDGKIADQALVTLEQIRNEPFFLAVGFLKPHLPFSCPKKYWDIYERSEIPLPSTDQPNDIWSSSLQEWGELRNNYSDIPSVDEGDLDEAKSRELKHGYWACVSYIDAQIGKLLEKLDELDLRENTIVVLWSDHGWKLGEYGDWCKHTNMELDVRIPFLMDVPGMENGVCHQPVESVDIYPTLMDLLEIEDFPDNLDGISMKPLLEDPEAEWKKAVFTQYPRYGGVMGTSVRTIDFRYTEYRDPAGNLKEYGELYDHSSYDENNPLGAEYHNLARDSVYDNQLKEMQTLINAGWDGVRYGASLSIKSQTENSVTLHLNRIPGAEGLKLFQRNDEGESFEIKAGQITQNTKEVSINNLETEKAYYFKLQIEWGEDKYNYSPEIGVVLNNKTTLVDNGHFFEAFEAGWTTRSYNDASMSYQVSDGRLLASVFRLGTNSWDLGFLNNKVSSFSNKDIALSFKAKANKKADIRLVMEFDPKQYYTQSIDTIWQTYTLHFPGVSSNAFQFKMWLTTLADYTIDEVELFYENTSTVQLEPQAGQGSTIDQKITSNKEPTISIKKEFDLFRTPSGYGIRCKGPVQSWELFDINGRKLNAQDNINTTTAEVNMSSVKNGIYILCIDGHWSQKLIW